MGVTYIQTHGSDKDIHRGASLDIQPCRSPEADIVESLVIDAVGLVGVLYQLVDGQGGVVGLHNSVRNL